MKSTRTLILLAAAFAGWPGPMARCAGAPPDSFQPRSLAPAEPANLGGGIAADEKAQAAELAKKLANPVASLISGPIQNNWDFGYGPENAMRYTANIQPVIPSSLGDDWNLIAVAACSSSHDDVGLTPVRPGQAGGYRVETHQQSATVTGVDRVTRKVPSWMVRDRSPWMRDVGRRRFSSPMARPRPSRSARAWISRGNTLATRS